MTKLEYNSLRNIFNLHQRVVFNKEIHVRYKKELTENIIQYLKDAENYYKKKYIGTKVKVYHTTLDTTLNATVDGFCCTYYVYFVINYHTNVDAKTSCRYLHKDITFL